MCASSAFINLFILISFKFFRELIEALSNFKKPLAAVVNGPAVGLGLTLLNHADLIIASDKATFCMPYSYLGYMPEGGATLTLPQVVGSTVVRTRSISFCYLCIIYYSIILNLFIQWF